MKRALPISLSLVLGACVAQAQWWEPGPTPGALVGVSVEVDGERAPLFPSPDGTNRFYLEARARASYAIALANRTGERLGVLLTVDGLNAISGERDPAPGRMYVLGPWEQMTVRGWRTSLADVRQFTFVDERASYAVRSGKANGRIGWIEAAVYREQRRYVARPRPRPWREYDGRSEESDSAGEARSRSMAPPASAPTDAADAPAKLEAEPAERSRADAGSRGSFPGTGWGPRAEDPAMVVSFEPESTPADRITLRYEYRSALLALGVLPQPWPPRDRLRERERGDSGFAKPPVW
jgi:hypothetical protein